MVIDLNNVDISIYDKTITTIDSFDNHNSSNDDDGDDVAADVFCKLIQLCCQDEMRIGTYKPKKGWINAHNVPK